MRQAPWHLIRYVSQTCYVVTNTSYCGSTQSSAIAWWRPPRRAHGNCGCRKLMVCWPPAPHDRLRLRPPAIYPDVASLSASVVFMHGPIAYGRWLPRLDRPRRQSLLNTYIRIYFGTIAQQSRFAGRRSSCASFEGDEFECNPFHADLCLNAPGQNRRLPILETKMRSSDCGPVENSMQPNA